MNIVPVQGHDLPEFIEFAWSIYGSDPLWIPPLREPLLRELSGDSAISRRWRIQPFLCYADGAVRGRIAAIINPSLIAANGLPIGQLGHFECVDDPDIAEGLVDAGMKWLREQGISEVLAPINGGAHRLYRLLVRGFEQTPFLFEPRNPAYYPRLLEHCGLEPRCRWYSYDVGPEEAREIHERLCHILAKRPLRGEVVALQPNQPQETIVRLHAILDACWSGHIGYAPMDLEEMTEVFAGLLSIMGPSDLSVFVQDHRDAGLAFKYPDYATQVRSLAGHAAAWGEWLGKSRAGRMVLSTSALIPEVRLTSAAVAQVEWLLDAALRDGFENILLALVLEGWLSRIAKPTREYVLYGRSLA